MSEVEARLFREHRFTIPRKHRREVRRRLRIGETVDAIVANLAPSPAPAAWDPPDPAASAMMAWRPIRDRIEKLPEMSANYFATWFLTLAAVKTIAPRAVNGTAPGATTVLILAAPSAAAAEWLAESHGELLARQAWADGYEVRLWSPANAEGVRIGPWSKAA